MTKKVLGISLESVAYIDPRYRGNNRRDTIVGGLKRPLLDKPIVEEVVQRQCAACNRPVDMDKDLCDVALMGCLCNSEV